MPIKLSKVKMDEMANSLSEAVFAKPQTFEERVKQIKESLPYLSQSGAMVLVSMLTSIETWGGKVVFNAVDTGTDAITLRLEVVGDIDLDVRDDVNQFAEVIRKILVVK